MKVQSLKWISPLVLATGLVFSASAASQPKRSEVAATAFHEVVIQTEPAAIVWIDGVRFGTTDKTGSLKIKTALSAGAHTLHVRTNGFKETSQPLTAAQNEIKAALVKTTDEAELAYQEAERLAGSEPERSADAYRKAIKLRPSYPEAYLGLARVLSDSSDFEAAQKAIASAKNFVPATPRPRPWRAVSRKITARNKGLSLPSGGRSPRGMAFSQRPMPD